MFIYKLALCIVQCAVLFSVENSSASTIFFSTETEIIDEYGDRTSMFYNGATVKVRCYTDRAAEIELVVNNNSVIAAAAATDAGNVSLNFTINKTTQIGVYSCRNKATKETSLETSYLGYYLCPDLEINQTCLASSSECLNHFYFCIVQNIGSHRCSLLDAKLHVNFDISVPKKVCAGDNDKVRWSNSLTEAFARQWQPIYSIDSENHDCASVPTIFFVDKTILVPMAKAISSTTLPNIKIVCISHSATLPSELFCTEKLKGGRVVHNLRNVKCNESGMFKEVQSNTVSAITKLTCTTMGNLSPGVSTHIFIVYLDQKPFFRQISECSTEAKQHTLRCGFSEDQVIDGYAVNVQVSLQNAVPPMVQMQLGMKNVFHFLIYKPGIYSCTGDIHFFSCSMQSDFTYASIAPPLITVDKGCFVDEQSSVSLPKWSIHLLIGLLIVVVVGCVMVAVVLVYRHRENKRKVAYLLGDATQTAATTTQTNRPAKSPLLCTPKMNKQTKLHYNAKTRSASKGTRGTGLKAPKEMESKKKQSKTCSVSKGTRYTGIQASPATVGKKKQSKTSSRSKGSSDTGIKASLASEGKKKQRKIN